MKAHLLVLLLVTTVSPQISGSQPNVVGWDIYGNSAYVPDDLTNAIALSMDLTDDVIALRADGTVVTWPSSPYTEFFDYVMTNLPPGMNDVTSVAVERFIGMALKGDGSVVSWGNHPPRVAAYSNAVAIAANSCGICGFGCILGIDGSPWQAENSAGPYLSIPTTGDWTNVSAISASLNALYALTRDGRVLGADSHGPMPLPAITNASSISAGAEYALALCGGRIVSTANLDWAPTITSASNIVAVAAGARAALAIKPDGTILAWGEATNVPPGLAYVEAVAAGGQRFYAIVDPSRAVNPPFIASQPRGRTLSIGSPLTVSVKAVGVPPLTYQWFFNGTNALSGATNSYLYIASTSGSNSGEYSVVVSNAVGATVSQPAHVQVLALLTVHTAPVIDVTGDVGASYLLQYISPIGDLGAWTDITTITLTNSSQRYVDLSAIGKPERFYRVQRLP